MPDGTDNVYGSSQINIPPTFPYILKQYAKAAIRTQPYDLLKWSASYFRALAKGETPPIKDRLEYPPPDTPSGLSPGYLKVLIKQIGKSGTVTVDQLVERWNGICLAEEPLHEMLAVGQFGETLDWLNFVAVAAGFLCNNLTQTMVLLCNLLTDEPEGGSALIPFHLFSKLYTFLAGLNCGDPHEDDDSDDKREYILSDGSRNHAHPHQSNPFQPSILDSSISFSGVISCFIDNNFSASERSFSSPEKTPVPSPCQSPPSPISESASTLTLVPEMYKFNTNSKGSEELAQSRDVGGHQVSNKSMNEHSEEPASEKEVIVPDKEVSEEGAIVSEDSVRHIASSDITVPIWAGDVMHQNPTTAEESSLKDKDGHGDVDEIQASEELKAAESNKIKKKKNAVLSVPGIGPVVDPVQVQAVLDYLKGLSLKQEDMVKPGNIRHFLCPPLEKVPASQKTRV